VVVGDVNSTLACSIVAAKGGLLVAHVEAGLRSRDWAMPEEVNRVVADHVSRWLFAPTPTAVANLAREGIVDGVTLVGDLMQDLASRVSREIRDSGALAGTPPGADLGLTPGGYLFATIHRAENRTSPSIAAWTSLLADLAGSERPVVLALHPGTRAAVEATGVTLGDDIRVIEPQGYRTTLTLELHAAGVLTDSGGVQREAAWLGVPCLVLRDTTEWVEAVEGSEGRMVLVGLDAARAREALDRLAPIGSTGAVQAAERAAALDLAPAGAGEAIASALEAGGPPPVTAGDATR
jgi:UDP-GlcNAc3NAcA epimerase